MHQACTGNSSNRSQSQGQSRTKFRLLLDQNCTAEAWFQNCNRLTQPFEHLGVYASMHDHGMIQ